jgi:cyclophilin family peptidyl-prolyl cis-trans isomerase
MKDAKIPLLIFFVLATFGLGFLAFYFSYSNSKQQTTMNDDDSTDVLGLTQTNPYSSKLNKYKKVPEIYPEAELANKKVIMKTNKGTIEFKLFGDEAPLTVSNFIFLTKDGYFDGLTFHRYEPGFVIQGGDPAGEGWGGPGYQFEDEPVTREYKKGIVAMANSGPDTNGSQFFIMLDDVPLPPLYTIFGEVTVGLDVVDKIRAGDKMETVTIENI